MGTSGTVSPTKGEGSTIVEGCNKPHENCAVVTSLGNDNGSTRLKLDFLVPGVDSRDLPLPWTSIIWTMKVRAVESLACLRTLLVLASLLKLSNAKCFVPIAIGPNTSGSGTLGTLSVSSRVLTKWRDPQPGQASGVPRSATRAPRSEGWSTGRRDGYPSSCGFKPSPPAMTQPKLVRRFPRPVPA